MGRAPCCEKVGLNRGPWTREEDLKLTEYITKRGEGCWRTLPKSAGTDCPAFLREDFLSERTGRFLSAQRLLRCGKSCRLRWINYLRPDLKRGNISEEEDQLIITLHTLLGNRWSLIAGRLPGRTDNEIKNYWNTHLTKKLRSMGIDPHTHRPFSQKQQQQQQQQLQAGVPADGQDGSNDQSNFNPAQLPQQLFHISTINAAAGLKPKSLISSFNHVASNGEKAATTRDANYKKSVALVESFLKDSVMYPDHSHMMHLPQLKEHHCAASDPLPAILPLSSSFSIEKCGSESLSNLGSPCSPVSILQQCCNLGCAERECSHMIADFSNSCSYSDLELEPPNQKQQPIGVFGDSPSIKSESTASSGFLVDQGLSTPSSYESGLTATTGWEGHVQLPEVTGTGTQSFQQLSSFLLTDIGDTGGKQSSYQMQESVTADHSSSTNSAHYLRMISNCTNVDDVSIWDMEILHPLTGECEIPVMDPTSISSMNDTICNYGSITSCSNMWEPEYAHSGELPALSALIF